MPALLCGDSNDFRETESRFCKDFSCCGVTLPSLHDLLQHYEEVHVCLEEEVDPEQPNPELLDMESLNQDWYKHSENLNRKVNMGWALEMDQKSAFQDVVYSSTTSNLKRKKSLEDLESPVEGESKREKLMWISEIPDIPHPPVSVISPTLASILVEHEDSFPIEDYRMVSQADLNEISSDTAATFASIQYPSPFISTPMTELPMPITLSHPPIPANSPSIISQSFPPPLEKSKIVRPHKCPIPGCDKSYKNSNGLKYHAAHGHPIPQDGDSFSKPFRCPKCSKTYKNLNGLKYHVEHSHLEFWEHLSNEGLTLASLPGVRTNIPGTIFTSSSSNSTPKAKSATNTSGLETPSSVGSISDLHTTFAIDDGSLLELERYSLEGGEHAGESSDENLPVAYAHTESYPEIFESCAISTSILSHY